MEQFKHNGAESFPILGDNRFWKVKYKVRNNCVSYPQPALTVCTHPTYLCLLAQGGFSLHFETCIKTVLDFEEA